MEDSESQEFEDQSGRAPEFSEAFLKEDDDDTIVENEGTEGKNSDGTDFDASDETEDS
jgi:hypothetical protein